MTLPDPVFQIKVSIPGTNPLIWRRILVPAGITLARLHIILQAVMGWENYHLHLFKVNGQEFGEPQDDEFDTRPILDEYSYLLPQAGVYPGVSFEYLYDFGDGWSHQLEVEAFHEVEPGEQAPRCIEGAESGPPEDVGGIGGYHEYKRVLKDRRHPRHREWLAWRGPFDPYKFDLQAINARLYWLSDAEGARKVGLNAVDALEMVMDYFPSLTRWAEGLDEELVSGAEELPLRRDMAVLLAYLRDHKVSGTSGTGNLPLKPAQEVSAQFVEPPVWKFEFGDFVDHVRSSAHIWPIYFLMVLAEVGELVYGGPGRRFRITQGGTEFMAAPAPLQTWYLLAVWWTRVNWLIAFPYEGFGEALPFGFSQTVGRRLMELPVGRNVAPDKFSDRLINEGRLKRGSEKQDRAVENLPAMIENCIIDPLVDFGILAPRYHTEAGILRERKTLVDFQITRFGRHFLGPLVYPGNWI